MDGFPPEWRREQIADNDGTADGEDGVPPDWVKAGNRPGFRARIVHCWKPIFGLLILSPQAFWTIVQPPIQHPTPAKLADLPHPDAQRGTVVDLFCGVGGLSHGFVLERFDVKAGIDVDPSCKHAYETNNRTTFYEKDVASISGDWVNSLFAPGKPRILVGCAPCQPYSSYTRSSRVMEDAKWLLLHEFGRIVQEVQPDVVSMENVPRLVTFQGGRPLQNFLACLSGYHVWSDVVECADFGVPQTRKRLVVLASRIGKIELADKTHTVDRHRTVRQTIDHMPSVDSGKICPDDALHQASRLSERNRRRIEASRPGGTWRDWSDRSLVSKCHTRRSGRFFNNVYGRMSWDLPAPTITTQCYGFGNGRFGHPEQDRAISLREAALLQTFPEYYEFQKPGHQVFIAHTARWIGNAVPVALGRAVARSVGSAIDAAELHDRKVN